MGYLTLKTGGCNWSGAGVVKSSLSAFALPFVSESGPIRPAAIGNASSVFFKAEYKVSMIFSRFEISGKAKPKHFRIYTREMAWSKGVRGKTQVVAIAESDST